MDNSFTVKLVSKLDICFASPEDVGNSWKYGEIRTFDIPKPGPFKLYKLEVHGESKANIAELEMYEASGGMISRGLNPGTQYTYEIIATNDAGDGMKTGW